MLDWLDDDYDIDEQTDYDYEDFDIKDFEDVHT